jgi:high-affinity iron transporter
VTAYARRGALLLLGALLVFGLWSASAQAATRPAQNGSVSKDEAIRQLDVVRESIDRTLALSKSGQSEKAFAEAKAGYLSHFEYVEIPLRVVAPQLTSDAETKFAEIRGLISSGASESEIRSNIVDLRGLIDDAERHLTDTGIGAPAVVFGQSFLIIFREGLEAVLLVSVLLGYLEAAKATQYRRPIVWGMGVAALATLVTFFLLRTVLDALPVGREVLEAITALLAVAVLFYVSFWLIARLEQKRWLEFLRARVWAAVSVGSTAALMLVGFTAVYREGFETALFYQALLSFGPGLGMWVAAGLGAGLVALALVAWAIFRLGRRVPLKAFLSTAVILLMATSVAFLGNAIRSLQEADVIALHRWPDWPRAPIFLSQSLGYWPSRETISAQLALITVYLLGALYVFVIRPRLRPASPSPAPASAPPVDAEPPLVDAHH